MVVFFGVTAQAASIAEISSILPIAGAQYRTLSFLAQDLHLNMSVMDW